MGQVAITLNGRTYKLECDDGEEQQLLGLAESVGRQIEALKGKFGQIGDDRLMLMAALMIADENAAIQAELDDANAKLDSVRQDHVSADALVQAAQVEMADQITAAAERIEALNAVLAAPTSTNGGE